MIFSQKITERGKPDPSECMSFLTARNQLAISYPVSTGSVFGPVESSGRLRVIFGSYSGFLGRVIPLTKKPEDSGYEIGCARIGEITVPMDKGNAGSGEENDSKCRQDPSGRPARVVKRWGGGGVSLSSVSRSHRMEIYFPFYEKQFGKRSPLWITIQERKSLFHAEKEAESPNTLYHALALRHVRINKLF